MDLDDLLDDNLVNPKKPKKQTSQPKATASIERGSAGSRSRIQQIDDDDDIFNLDNEIKKPMFSNKNNSVKGASGTQSKVAALWGGSNQNLNSNSKINTSFGASNKGSDAGSRKSRQEEEADEFDDMLNQIDGGGKPAEPIPTGTFRKEGFRNDGWEDI